MGYKCIIKSATKRNEAGRASGGTLVLVRSSLQLQSPTVNESEFGDWISFVLGSQYKFHVIYRKPSTPIVEISEVFTELLNTNM